MSRPFPPPLLVSSTLSAGLESLQRKRIEGEAARQKLGELLQAALNLEFATIPPYLSAVFSIVDGNEAIQQLILRVAKEEMLHMTAVANLMNAIRVSPNIIMAAPEYPFDLATVEPPLHLELKSFSFDLVEKLFMKIEAPEDPVNFPSFQSVEGEAAPATIGQFYQGIINLIQSGTIPDLFVNAERDIYKQVEIFIRFSPVNYLNDADDNRYPLRADIDFLIKDQESAVRHLSWIISEGEGAEKFNPLGPEGIPGHYYRFESILESRYLVKDTTVVEGFSYSGGTLPFSPDGIHEFDPNAKVENYAAFQQVERRMKRFNDKYTEMINLLQTAFNCPTPEQRPEAIEAYKGALSAMRDMPGITTTIIAAARTAGIKAGIPFHYKPSGPVIT